jgi:AcrR family transcriptional regulator
VTPTARRRGDALRDAVFDAALAEVAEVGLRGASMTRIAQRAGTGKAALYRRWPNVRTLALDVFVSTLESGHAASCPDTGSLRGDLLGSMTSFATELQGDLGLVVRELISEAAHDPSLSAEFQQRIGQEMDTDAVAVIQRAMVRGEIPLRPVDPVVLQVPAAMIVHELVMTGRAPTEPQLAHIVDAIVLPLLRLPVDA